MVKNLLAAPEGKTLEFKRDLSSPKPLLKTLVAFANSAGGRLVIGVADDKQIIGVADPLAEEERLCNLIADSIKDMKRGVSQIRNPVIARVFRELSLIEQWGSGIPSVFREAVKLGLPPLEILESALRLRFTVPLHEPILLKTRTGTAQHVKPATAGAQSGTLSGSQVEAQVEAQVDLDILSSCASRPLSSAEIAAALGHKQLSGNLRKAIPRLRTAGLLEYTLPERPTSRLQKYRLTPKDRSLLTHTFPP